MQVPFRKHHVTFYKQDKTKYYGVCDCGNEVQRTIKYIKKNPKCVNCSCGCQSSCKLQGQTSIRWKGTKDISGHKFAAAKCGAKNRNIDFNITIQDMQDQWDKQEGKCALTKVKLIQNISARVNKGKNTASLDRIDSNKPYTKDNIQWIHKHVQKMKNKYNQDYFIQICKDITKWKQL